MTRQQRKSGKRSPFPDLRVATLPGDKGFRLTHIRTGITVTLWEPQTPANLKDAALTLRNRVDMLGGVWYPFERDQEPFGDGIRWKQGLRAEAKGFTGQRELLGQE